MLLKLESSAQQIGMASQEGESLTLEEFTGAGFAIILL